MGADGKRSKALGCRPGALMGGCWNETLDCGSSLGLGQPRGPERCRAGAAPLERAGCQCDIQHRDWEWDTALLWQKLSLPVPAFSQPVVGQGQELAMSVECPQGTPGRRGTQTFLCWDSHPDAGPSSLPCPLELCFPSLSRMGAVLVPSQNLLFAHTNTLWGFCHRA